MTGNVGAITQSAMFESLPTNTRCDEQKIVQISDRVHREEVWQGGKHWAIECRGNSKQHFATPHGPQLFGQARVHEPHCIWPDSGL